MEIKNIVSSYGLSKKVEEKIISFSTQRIQELGLVTFDEQYRYIAGLVEKFQQDTVLHYALRLDAPLSINSGRLYESQTLHDRIGALPSERLNDHSLDLAIVMADPNLSEKHKNLIQRLLKDLESTKIVLPNQGSVSFSTVIQRLETLTEYLERRVCIIYPERPISAVQLNSENPKIFWGKRNYSGNPLAYFRRHLDVYAGISRHKLGYLDSGLLEALYKYNQIDEAIPKRGNIPREPRSPEQVARIISAYSTYGGNCRLSAKELGMDRHEVRKVWRKEKLIAQGGVQRRLPPDEVSRIIKAYELYDGNATVSAEKLGIDRSNVRNVWKRRGLKPAGKSSNNFTPEEKSTIIGAHQLYHGNCSQAAQKLGFSLGGVWKIWNQQGLKAVGSRFGNQGK